MPNRLEIDQQLKTELAFIKSNFTCITFSVIKLQTNGRFLEVSLQAFESVGEPLKSLQERLEFKRKFNQLVARDKDLPKIKQREKPQSQIIIPFRAFHQLKSAHTLTSSNVERSFSKY